MVYNTMYVKDTSKIIFNFQENVITRRCIVNTLGQLPKDENGKGMEWWGVGYGADKSNNKESFACPKIMDHELGSFNHLNLRFRKHL